MLVASNHLVFVSYNIANRFRLSRIRRFAPMRNFTLALSLNLLAATLASADDFGIEFKPLSKTVMAYTLVNEKGMKARIMNYGGIITELWVPDKNGKLADVVLGHDELKSYEDGHPYFGAITGRVANRIAKGKFTLDGKEYTLAVNNGPNALHGGKKGFDKVIWEAKTEINNKEPLLRLTY